MANLTRLEHEQIELATPAPPSLEGLIAAWLHAKTGRSGSERTATAYRTAIARFRAALQGASLDLDGDAALVGLAAQSWAGHSARGRAVSPATYNQRLAILSSFYQYAIRHGLLEANPLDRVDRRPVQPYGSAQPLDYQALRRKLAQIDRETPLGLRDYALLSVALHTGRRVSELASLRWGHLLRAGEALTLHFPRAKGGKAVRDRLPAAAARALLAWLQRYYGAELGALPSDAPLWPSLSRRNPGRPMSIQAIADVCERRLGISKVHALRHTFARAMEDAGAKVSEIQSRLGHTSLSTTGRYLAALRSADNPHGDALSELLGLED